LRIRVVRATARGEGRRPAGREIAILGLIAAGHRYRDIGEPRFINHTPVARHVANRFGKFGTDCRSKATTDLPEHTSPCELHSLEDVQTGRHGQDDADVSA
jgi:DNA-binding NarL/FixJ family response regulator